MSSRVYVAASPSGLKCVERPTSRLSKRTTCRPRSARPSQKSCGNSTAPICSPKPATRTISGSFPLPKRSYSSRIALLSICGMPPPWPGLAETARSGQAEPWRPAVGDLVIAVDADEPLLPVICSSRSISPPGARVPPPRADGILRHHNPVGTGLSRDDDLHAIGKEPAEPSCPPPIAIPIESFRRSERMLVGATH